MLYIEVYILKRKKIIQRIPLVEIYLQFIETFPKLSELCCLLTVSSPAEVPLEGRDLKVDLVLNVDCWMNQERESSGLGTNIKLVDLLLSGHGSPGDYWVQLMRQGYHLPQINGSPSIHSGDQEWPEWLKGTSHHYHQDSLHALKSMCSLKENLLPPPPWPVLRTIPCATLQSRAINKRFPARLLLVDQNFLYPSSGTQIKK